MLIKFFAYYREPRFAGVKRIDASGLASVRDVLLFCCDKYPGFRGELLTADQTQIGPDAIVMVNGRNIAHLDGLDTALGPDDAVSIFPRCAGG